MSYAGLLAALDGSIGGTWIDASPSGLASVQYVQFLVADDGDPGTKLTIDAVTSIAVPEPAVATCFMGAALLLVARRRR
jgi:hypothetical protein